MYVIHFDRPLLRVSHYVGWAKDAAAYERRMQRHRDGKGAKLLAELGRRGIGWRVVVIYPEGDRAMERMIKRHKSIPKAYCPLCMAERRAARAASGNGRESDDGIRF